MVDVFTDTIIDFHQAAALFGVHVSTVFRWATAGAARRDGVRVRLEAVRYGPRKLMTSKQAVQRFVDRLGPTFGAIEETAEASRAK